MTPFHLAYAFLRFFPNQQFTATTWHAGFHYQRIGYHTQFEAEVFYRKEWVNGLDILWLKAGAFRKCGDVWVGFVHESIKPVSHGFPEDGNGINNLEVRYYFDK